MGVNAALSSWHTSSTKVRTGEPVSRSSSRTALEESGNVNRPASRNRFHPLRASRTIPGSSAFSFAGNDLSAFSRSIEARES